MPPVSRITIVVVYDCRALHAIPKRACSYRILICTLLHPAHSFSARVPIPGWLEWRALSVVINYIISQLPKNTFIDYKYSKVICPCHIDLENTRASWVQARPPDNLLQEQREHE